MTELELKMLNLMEITVLRLTDIVTALEKSNELKTEQLAAIEQARTTLQDLDNRNEVFDKVGNKIDELIASIEKNG